MDEIEPALLKLDGKIEAFVQEVTETLREGKRYMTPGLGTFSTCARKATADRAACKMAMFRASPELREFAVGGPRPNFSGPHAKVLKTITNAMQNEQGVNVPLLGLMAMVPVPGKKPKLIFHAANELNNTISSQ